ncbi:MAG: hypothetical protein AAGF36_12440 [Pseudomonadota bacterium]
MNTLAQRLRAAYTADNRAALVALYQEAARHAPNEDERAFFLTQAHVFALEIAHPDTADLRAELVRMGREQPL